MLTIKPITSGTVTPVDYSHNHDKTLVLTKYRENFNFGLAVNDYYFNQNPKDKKSNFNTQYVLTDLYPLSSIVELKTPFTTAAVSAFTTTIKHGDKYLKTDISHTNNTVSAFSSFTDTLCSLSSNYFFTINISSTPTLPARANEQQIFITQEISGITWYLVSDSATTTPAAWLSAGTTTDVGMGVSAANSIPQALRFALSGDKLSVINSTSKSRVRNNSDSFDWILTSSLTTAALLSTTYFTINRNYLTDGFKYIPNSYSKYVSSFNTDTVDLNTSTTVQHISNNYFVFSNNYKFKNYDLKSLAKNQVCYP